MKKVLFILSIVFSTSCIAQITSTPKIFTPMTIDDGVIIQNSLRQIENRRVAANNAYCELLEVIAYYRGQLPNDNTLLSWYEDYIQGIIKRLSELFDYGEYGEVRILAPRYKGEIANNVIKKIHEYQERIKEIEAAEIEEQRPHVWSGTGFALKKDYIVTNYHVVEDAKTVEVYGISGDFSTSYRAKVIGFDKESDLALLKMDDTRFKSLGLIPYSFQSAMAEVGENVYVLGYPLIQSMGEEIKLTNGIISARSGFDGNVANYQISVPLQPGNSGGPMFNMKGSLVGVVCAKHSEAENASYAIKTSYLKNLVESVADQSILPNNKSLLNLQLKDQVKRIKNFVYIVKCYNEEKESDNTTRTGDEKTYDYQDGMFYYTIISERERTVEISKCETNTLILSVEIPSTVEINKKGYTSIRIGKSAFAGCCNLTEITIPKGVKDIENEAFYGCKNLEKIKILSSNPPTCSSSNSFYDYSAILLVPMQSVDAYRSVSPWNQFKKIVGF